MWTLAVCPASHVGAIHITSRHCGIAAIVAVPHAHNHLCPRCAEPAECRLYSPLARGLVDPVICCSFTLFLLRRGAFPSDLVRADLFSDHPSRRAARQNPVDFA